jgi:hypothetical protein
MTIPEQKNLPARVAWRSIAADLLLGIGVGTIISLLVFLGYYYLNGAANLLEIVPMFFVLIFVNTPYSTVFRLVILVPIYAPLISILIARSRVEKAASRRGWMITALLVAAVSAAAVVAITLAGAFLLGLGGIDLVGKLLLAATLSIVLGSLVGMALGSTFVPVRRGAKILIAVIASAVMGGFFEGAFLYYITRQTGGG